MPKQQSISALINIANFEEKNQVNQTLEQDKYLEVKLVKSGANEVKVNEAREEVKRIFSKKGIVNNNPMFQMIDTISDNLLDTDISKGNLIQNMFGMAQSIAQDMQPTMSQNPDQFKNTLNTMTSVFKEAVAEGTKEAGDQVPAELRSMVDNILSKSDSLSDENAEQELENIIQASGLNRDTFMSGIHDENGAIDVTKLESMMANVHNSKFAKQDSSAQ